MKIESSQKNMRGLRLVGEEENGNAFSPYGPVKVGLTITHRTQQVQLSASLKELERRVDDLHSRYCQAYVTLIDVTERLAKLSASIINADTIDSEEEEE
jgi:hypothetical protein